MQDADEIARYSLEKYPDLAISGLALNGRGVENAVKTGLKEVNYVISVSEEHNLMNTKRTHDQSFGELAPMIERYPDVTFVLDLAMAFGYYTEEVSLDSMMAFLKRWLRHRPARLQPVRFHRHRRPQNVKERVDCVTEGVPDCRFRHPYPRYRKYGVYQHRNRDRSRDLPYTDGARRLGGCPFAHGATGKPAPRTMCLCSTEWAMRRR
jgi:hydroxymethylglutaryl-CoA lyase